MVWEDRERRVGRREGREDGGEKGRERGCWGEGMRDKGERRG